ncbi:MAG: hypothetical protein IJQ43_03430 [Oscillospiraceae bacterium]|nr:hypothetical protein [Oscillospiraceae bacterium]
MRRKHWDPDLLAERLELPEEALGALLVTAVGRRRVLIENHRGIAQYSDACLRLKAAGGTFSLYGSGIRILTLGRHNLAVEGDIGSMEWEG